MGQWWTPHAGCQCARSTSYRQIYAADTTVTSGRVQTLKNRCAILQNVTRRPSPWRRPDASAWNAGYGVPGRFGDGLRLARFSPRTRPDRATRTWRPDAALFSPDRAVPGRAHA